MRTSKVICSAIFTAMLGAVATSHADDNRNESGKNRWEQRGDHRRDQARHDDKDRGRHDRKDRRGEGEGERDRYEDRTAYSAPPKGHMPPPGECKLWYPDRPAGHQPPPIQCENLGVETPRRH